MTKENKDIEALLKNSEEIAEQFNAAMKFIENEQEAYWNSLTKDQQLMVFCAVTRRIYQAELVDQGTYRHALYSVFGFGPESYAQAQEAGYLALHNAIMAEDHDIRLLEAFCTINGIDDAEEKIKKFWM